jgi:quercetin dioxygenase-like cupin family protein
MSQYFPQPADAGRHVIFGNVPIRTYAGEHLQLSLVDIPPGAVIDWHQHPNEQMGMVLAGRALFFIGDEHRELAAGAVYWMPANTPHRVVALDEPVQALDVFYPIRPEYR